jgi:photosystem II stability/assembly factor-like uncharacterized protein
MSKLKGFVAACALVLAVSALLAGVCTGSARAGGASQIAFADAQRGWRVTLEGSSYDPFTWGRSVLWGTADGGETWQRLASQKPGNSSDGGIVPGMLGFYDASLGLWGRPYPVKQTFLRTTDSGTHWKESSLKVTGLLSDFTFASRRVVWACDFIGSALSGGSIYKSTDGGVSWRVSKRAGGGPGTPDGFGDFNAISSPTTARCYVAAGGRQLGGLWVTSDGGSHWTRRTVPGGGASAVSFSAPGTGWVAASNGLYRTTDDGRSWSRRLSGTGLNLWTMCFVDAQHGWVAGGTGSLRRTVDGGKTWQRLATGSGASLSALVFVDAMHGWASGRGGDYPDYWDVLLRTTDGGQTWTELP